LPSSCVSKPTGYCWPFDLMASNFVTVCYCLEDFRHGTDLPVDLECLLTTAADGPSVREIVPSAGAN